jgi:hypothetical protein
MDILTEKLRKDGNLVGLKTRPARALIGWMPQQEAQLMLGIPLDVVTPLPEHVRRVRDAHAAVRSRPIGIDQTHLLSDIGAEWRNYFAQLQEHPGFRPYIASGYTIRIANLNQICALQPVVHLDYLDHSDHFRTLNQQAVQEDMLSLAKVTLPIPAPMELPVQSDKRKNTWLLQFRDPHTQVVGHFNTRVELTPGVFGMAYGLCIALPPSFVQVVLYRGRYFLKDGYHRSLALLEKGITHIPVMFQELSESQSLEVDGRFPDETILGIHPPLFSDYLREDVAALVSHLASQKTITIQSTDNVTWG